MAAGRRVGRTLKNASASCGGGLVQVVAADYAFRIARLQRRVAHRAELRHVHRNERVPQNIVPEAELLADACQPPQEIFHHGRNDRVFV
jgi:hypothetical protein